MEVQSEIPFAFGAEEFGRMAYGADSAELQGEVRDFLQTALPLVKPKALMRVAYIEGRAEDSIRIDTALFQSRALCINLEKVERVFPYIATCGTELDEIDLGRFDMLAYYWLEALKMMAVRAAVGFLRRRIENRYGVAKLAAMNPGAADRDVWPLEQQRELFSLFGQVRSLIGVTLTPSCLMVPNKSVSGIFFPSDINFVNCQLCTRGECPNRKAPFQSRLPSTD